MFFQRLSNRKRLRVARFLHMVYQLVPSGETRSNLPLLNDPNLDKSTASTEAAFTGDKIDRKYRFKVVPTE